MFEQVKIHRILEINEEKHTENNKYEISSLVYLRITIKKQKEKKTKRKKKLLNFFSVQNFKSCCFCCCLFSLSQQPVVPPGSKRAKLSTQRIGKTIHVVNYICSIVILNVNTYAVCVFCFCFDTDVLIFHFYSIHFFCTCFSIDYKDILQFFIFFSLKSVHFNQSLLVFPCRFQSMLFLFCSFYQPSPKTILSSFKHQPIFFNFPTVLFLLSICFDFLLNQTKLFFAFFFLTQS